MGMLVLGRRVAEPHERNPEYIQIDTASGTIRVYLMRVGINRGRIGIEAPQSCVVRRSEVIERMDREERQAMTDQEIEAAAKNLKQL